MSTISELDRAYPLLSESTNFVTLFAKDLPTQHVKLLGLRMQKLWLTFKSSLTPNFNKDELRFTDHKIYYKEHKIASIYRWYKFRNYLIRKTRNIQSLQVAKAKTDIVMAEKYRELLRLQLKKDLEKLELPEDQYSVQMLEREKLFDLTISKLKPADFGLCLAMTITLAKKKLRENMSWTEAVQAYSKGGDDEVSGYQSLFNAHRDGIVTSWHPFDAISSISGIYLDFITMQGNDKDRIEKIAALEPGVYAIGIHMDRGWHYILYHKADDLTFVIDPNIGLMRCQIDETKKLLALIVSDYNMPKPDIFVEKGLLPSKQHELLVEKLSAVPMHWYPEGSSVILKKD